MNAICDLLQVLSAGVIGLLVGALLAEGALFVPYWRSLPADTFYSLHKVYGPRLYRFFAPLTIAPMVLIAAAAGMAVWTADAGRWATLAAGVLFLMVLATYGMYFKRANAQFAAASLAPESLALELARWERWQWARVALGLGAFFVALMGVGMIGNG